MEAPLHSTQIRVHRWARATGRPRDARLTIARLTGRAATSTHRASEPSGVSPVIPEEWRIRVREAHPQAFVNDLMGTADEAISMRTLDERTQGIAQEDEAMRREYPELEEEPITDENMPFLGESR